MPGMKLAHDDQCEKCLAPTGGAPRCETCDALICYACLMDNGDCCTCCETPVPPDPSEVTAR